LIIQIPGQLFATLCVKIHQRLLAPLAQWCAWLGERGASRGSIVPLKRFHAEDAVPGVDFATSTTGFALCLVQFVIRKSLQFIPKKLQLASPETPSDVWLYRVN
jgi:hypothetical protein